MANYNSPTVITEPMLLNELLLTLLQWQGGDEEEAEGEEGILDALANERMPLKTYYVSFGEGWNTSYELDDYYEAQGEDRESMIEKHGVEFTDALETALKEWGEAYTLHEILKLNPDMQEISAQTSYTCSKMRVDGWGGCGIHVNRKGYLYISTGDVTIDEDGTIALRSVFSPWGDE